MSNSNLKINKEIFREFSPILLLSQVFRHVRWRHMFLRHSIPKTSGSTHPATQRHIPEDRNKKNP